MTLAESNKRLALTLSEHKDRYDRAVSRQASVFMGGTGLDTPLLLSAELTESQKAAFPDFNTKEAHNDLDRMLASQARSALTAMNAGMDAVPSVRANMGVGITASFFGVKPRLFDDKMPWVTERVPKARLERMTADDLAVTPEIIQAIEHMEYMADALDGSGVRVYPVDVQGAFDTAHIALGDQIFYEIYDDPDFLRHLLDLSCAAAERAFDECVKRIPGSEETICHYNQLAMPRKLGGMKISEDTSTLLSQEQIDEFVAPYTRRLLSYSGGGYVHYCGRNDYLFRTVLAEPLAYGLNFGNPEKHNMEECVAALAAKGKVYYGASARNGGESRADYYARTLAASLDNGRSRLLLCDSCAADEVGAVRDEWEKAKARVFA
ncbi:MAG: hypothetical protein LBS11_00285 [Oscillospiraceae bacterium]|jgi:hypothetical protein|nr:hypothetical protein [Oscillospiraceae bacterium]